MKKISGYIATILALLTVTLALPASAQTYPTKPIDIILGFSAGGTTDLAARVFASALEAKWGVPVRVVNKPGGNAVPAIDEVMRAAPDGYTMLLDGTSQSSMLDVLVKTLPWKVMDRTFVAMLVQTPHIVMVPENSPFQTIGDLAAAIKKDPGSITWATSGSPAFAFRKWVDSLGVDIAKMRALPQRGGAETVTLTAGGHVTTGITAWPGIAGVYRGNRLRLLAIMGPQRIPQAPEVPTIAEAGFPEGEVMYWVGVSGPPGLPADIVDKWQKAIVELLKDPNVVARFDNIGLMPFYRDGKAMTTFVSDERAAVQRVWPK